MLRDVEAGDEILIKYGKEYFESQRAKIAHSVRSALEAWSLRKSLEKSYIATTMTLLAIIERVLSACILCCLVSHELRGAQQCWAAFCIAVSVIIKITP